VLARGDAGPRRRKQAEPEDALDLKPPTLT
jgi:hypothetical protein